MGLGKVMSFLWSIYYPYLSRNLPCLILALCSEDWKLSLIKALQPGRFKAQVQACVRFSPPSPPLRPVPPSAPGPGALSVPGAPSPVTSSSRASLGPELTWGFPLLWYLQVYSPAWLDFTSERWNSAWPSVELGDWTISQTLPTFLRAKLTSLVGVPHRRVTELPAGTTELGQALREGLGSASGRKRVSGLVSGSSRTGGKSGGPWEGGPGGAMENHSPALPSSAWPTQSPAGNETQTPAWSPRGHLPAPRGHPGAPARGSVQVPALDPGPRSAPSSSTPTLRASPGLRSRPKTPGPFSAPQNSPEPLTLSFYLRHA